MTLRHKDVQAARTRQERRRAGAFAVRSVGVVEADAGHGVEAPGDGLLDGLRVDPEIGSDALWVLLEAAFGVCVDDAATRSSGR